MGRLCEHTFVQETLDAHVSVNAKLKFFTQRSISTLSGPKFHEQFNAFTNAPTDYPMGNPNRYGTIEMTTAILSHSESLAVALVRREPLNNPLRVADTVICQCTQITRSILMDAVENGCDTVQALSTLTGAGTICGGCSPRLAELTAETVWQAVRCLDVIERAPGVKSFRFEVPAQHGAVEVRPGQRLIVQATIGGVDVQRPYTLTSAATERGYYEITVQREPHGIMSNWLFDNMRPGRAVAILPPSGTCSFELREPRPLVCLVGGIGVTPALGICRSAAASGAKRRVHVDYSVSTRRQMVCAEELTEIASRHPSITCRTRITREQGRFDAAELASLSLEFRDCDWLICGSKSFRADAERLLVEHGITPRYIHIESFHAFTDAICLAPASTAVLSPRQRRLTGYGLLIAIAAFVVQAQFGMKWPLLDRLQATTVYSALTGTALLVLLMLQWRLAYLRLRNGVVNTARAYGLHVAIGPAVLGVMWLHSTHLGYGLSMAVCLSFLGSLASGAVLGAHPRSPRWKRARAMLLAGHIALSCSGSGFAVMHGFTALWY
jgi:ferredoxin-NADP reductase